LMHLSIALFRICIDTCIEICYARPIPVNTGVPQYNIVKKGVHLP